MSPTVPERVCWNRWNMSFGDWAESNGFLVCSCVMAVVVVVVVVVVLVVAVVDAVRNVVVLGPG